MVNNGKKAVSSLLASELHCIRQSAEPCKPALSSFVLHACMCVPLQAMQSPSTVELAAFGKRSGVAVETMWQIETN